MDRGDGRRASLLAKLGLAVVITCNSVVAAYGSWGDPWSLAFVALADAALLLLLHFLRRFDERAAAPPGDRGRAKAKAKAAVWALSTLLTAMFAARVATLTPVPVGVAVWAMAAVTTGGGFWALFVC